MQEEEHIDMAQDDNGEAVRNYYTYADYINFKFDHMVELIRGQIFKMSPSPRSVHQKILGNIYLILGNYLKNKNCQVFLAPFDVILPIQNKKRGKSNTVVQPDIVVICNPDIIEAAGCFGVPDWVIEIVSPHTINKDIRLKYEIYEEVGINEYWIVYPDEEIIEVFVLENGKYKMQNSYTKFDKTFAHTLPELEVDFKEVF